MNYRLSTDYEALFAAIAEGHEIAAFVDYKLSEGITVRRDICLVRRTGPYQISIAARGTQYGGLYPFDAEDGEERALFIVQCKAMNLEWIAP